MSNDKASFIHRVPSSPENQKLTSIMQDISPHSFLSLRDRCNSITGSSRNISPVTFFHDGLMLNELDFHSQCTAAERRARAIATAPRRNRYKDDDDDESEQKTNVLGLRKTSAVPIPKSSDSRQTQSLPPIHQHDVLHSPRQSSDGACAYVNEYCHRSHSLVPSPNNIPLWRS